MSKLRNFHCDSDKAVKEGGDLEMHLVELAFTAGQAINLSFFKKLKGFKFSSQTIASRLRSK